ncbi:electron transport complex subunit RsxE [candidate division KSB1 bacterium]|nr:MAG: electron transport complex subunit RsxE [candidate division KSB1 bacterium]
MTLSGELLKGIYKENPVLRLALGLCPTLAVSNSVINGIGMGTAFTFVLLGSNIIVSLIKKGVPDKIRIPVYIVIIASFVTIADLFMAGFAPKLHKALGIFVPLIVVNCIILGRAEAFASKNSLGRSILDAIGMGIGFTLTLVFIGFFREFLGDGKVLGTPVMGSSFEPVLLFILPPGAFLSLGFLMGFLNWIDSKKVRK